MYQSIKSSMRIWLPLVLVVVAYFYAVEKLATSDVERKKYRKQDVKRVIKVAPLKQSTVYPKWQATGVVKAAEQVNIVAEVTGKILDVNEQAKPGYLLNKGDWLVELDKTDYQLNLQSQQAQLVQAQANLALEKAEQQLAKEELSLIQAPENSAIEMSLVLREPQFKVAQAKLQSAQANVKKAQVAIGRTSVKMPFQGKIIKRNIGRGSRVGQNSTLFSVVNVESFWLEVKVPRSFLTILDTEKKVKLSQPLLWGEGVTRNAKVISVLPELDSRDRQAKLLLAIDDPLLVKQQANTDKDQVKQPKVFVNDFVNASLTGAAIENAWTIETEWLLSDNTIWVVDKAKTMQKRKVEILFKGRDQIYVTGEFKAGDVAIVDKPLVTAIGMKVVPKFIDGEQEASTDTNKYKKLRKKKRDANAKKKKAKAEGSV